MTSQDASLILACFGPVAFCAGCLFGARYPWLILGRNRHGRNAD